MILLILLGLLPSFIWLSFFLQEDIHPEPRRMIFFVFLGGVVAAILAFFGQYAFQIFIEKNGIGTENFFPIAFFAAIEEIFKFLVVFAIVSKSKYFDEPVDAMIYMIGAATGMAAVENVALMLGLDFFGEKIGILVFRFLGATLLHVLSSALAGFWWAKGIIKKKTLVFIVIGLVSATLLHALFNYFIMIFKNGIIYSIVFLVLAAFFIFYDFEKLKKIGRIN